ncbi:MAG TPA: hypothetical protein VG013_41875 [Gemmataceae bacterium]|jgi:hypothetical protein|nr:hypothetical protein [Gemmataceae bacterium]
MTGDDLPAQKKAERHADLLKDGGRTVVYGGDPYEDDVERVLPADNQPGDIEEALKRGLGSP